MFLPLISLFCALISFFWFGVFDTVCVYVYVGGCRRQVAGGREESEMSTQVGGADYGICDYCAKWSHGLLSNCAYSGCCPECRVELNTESEEI